jgi:hypothetical protein
MKNSLIWSIRWTGWLGFSISLVSILTANLQLFLIAQIVAGVSSFLWSLFIQKKVTLDLIICLILTVIASVTKEPFMLYSSMLVRSFSYQLQFERVVSDRNHTLA